MRGEVEVITRCVGRRQLIRKRLWRSRLSLYAARAAGPPTATVRAAVVYGRPCSRVDGLCGGGGGIILRPPNPLYWTREGEGNRLWEQQSSSL